LLARSTHILFLYNWKIKTIKTLYSSYAWVLHIINTNLSNFCQLIVFIIIEATLLNIYGNLGGAIFMTYTNNVPGCKTSYDVSTSNNNEVTAQSYACSCVPITQPEDSYCTSEEVPAETQIPADDKYCPSESTTTQPQIQSNDTFGKQKEIETKKQEIQYLKNENRRNTARSFMAMGLGCIASAFSFGITAALGFTYAAKESVDTMENNEKIEKLEDEIKEEQGQEQQLSPEVQAQIDYLEAEEQADITRAQTGVLGMGVLGILSFGTGTVLSGIYTAKQLLDAYSNHQKIKELKEQGQ